MVVVINNDISLKQAIKEAKGLKKHGGVGRIYVELSNSMQDSINKAINKSNELLNKLMFL